MNLNKQINDTTEEVKEFSVNTFLSEKIGNNVQVIIFVIDNVEFAIDIMDVKEIKEMDRIRRLPNAHPYVKGLLNLRGDIIPVIDLKKRLELDNLKLEDIEKLGNIRRSGNRGIETDKENRKNTTQDEIDKKIKNNNAENEGQELKSKNISDKSEDILKTAIDKESEEKSNIPAELRDKNIIICNVENTMFGILIDHIVQVSYLSDDQFEQAPKLISTIGEKFLIGFAKINKKIIPILNLYKLIFGSED